jgi:type II secretory pathway pseudopilin PulG
MRSRTQRPRGLTLIEAMLLLVIMSIIAVSAGIGLQAVAKVPAKTDEMMAINNALVSTLEQWKANPTTTIPTAPDTVTINGKTYTRVITVEYADPTSGTDPATFSTTKTDYYRISVTINGQTMRCYVTDF